MHQSMLKRHRTGRLPRLPPITPDYPRPRLRDYPFLAALLCGHVRQNVSHFCIGIVIFLCFLYVLGGSSDMHQLMLKRHRTGRLPRLRPITLDYPRPRLPFVGTPAVLQFYNIMCCYLLQS